MVACRLSVVELGFSAMAIRKSIPLVVSLDELNGILEEPLGLIDDDCGFLVVVEGGDVKEAGGGYGGWGSGDSIAGGGFVACKMVFQLTLAMVVPKWFEESGW